MKAGAASPYRIQKQKTEPFGSASSSLFSSFEQSLDRAIQAVETLNQPTISVSANQ